MLLLSAGSSFLHNLMFNTYSSKGRSLELYFIDGKPDGMLTAEVFNWTGHVLVTPRTQLKDALKRTEAGYTGVYLLLGEQDGNPLMYIGEGEDISARIRNHEAKVEWWNKAVLVTTSANMLNKAHVKYLESRLIQEALAVGRVPLRNGNAPALPGLSESARANMEGFLDYLLMVLPAIGIDAFVRRTRSKPIIKLDPTPSAEPVFELNLSKHGIYATAVMTEGEFVVQAGSEARVEWVGSKTHNYLKLYSELVGTGILALNGGKHRTFTANYAFSSPSAAGAVVTGRSCNGQVEWKLKGTNKTYADWEQEQLNNS